MANNEAKTIGPTGATLSMQQKGCRFYVSEGSQCRAGGDRGPGAKDGLCFIHDEIEVMEMPADLTNLPGDPVAEKLAARIAAMIGDCEAEFVKALTP